MNKKDRLELAALAKKFSRTLSKKNDERGDDRYCWDELATKFFDWLNEQKTLPFPVEQVVDLMTGFRETLDSGEVEEGQKPDYEFYWCDERYIWDLFVRKFLLYCQKRPTVE